jgi:hypothetical protein
LCIWLDFICCWLPLRFSLPYVTDIFMLLLPLSLLILSILLVSSKKYLLRSTNCGVLRCKIIFTMFLLRLNILLLPAESGKADPRKYVNKEAQQESKVSFCYKTNQRIKQPMFLFLESERRTFLKWMKARIYRIKSWLSLYINKRSIVYILSTNIGIFGFITLHDFVGHAEEETKTRRSVLSVYFYTSVLINV